MYAIINCGGPSGKSGWMSYCLQYVAACQQFRSGNRMRREEGNGPGVNRLAVSGVKFGHSGDLGGIRNGVLENKACQRGRKRNREGRGRTRDESLHT